jgi:hypothetical protein
MCDLITGQPGFCHLRPPKISPRRNWTRLNIAYSGFGRMHRALAAFSKNHVVGMCARLTNATTFFTLPSSANRPALRKLQHYASLSQTGQILFSCRQFWSRKPFSWASMPFMNHTNARHISWSLRLQPRPSEPNGIPDDEEDLTKATIQDQVMKGRNPTDLMLRCEPSFPLMTVLLHKTNKRLRYYT